MKFLLRIEDFLIFAGRSSSRYCTPLTTLSSTTLILIQSNPVVWRIMPPTAFMFNWSPTFLWAICRIPIIKSFFGPKSMIDIIENFFLRKHIVHQFQVAFKKLTFARSRGVWRNQFVFFRNPAPGIFSVFSDTVFAVSGSNALLAIFVRFAFVVQRVNWLPLAHLRHWPITQKETVTTVGPVFSLVETIVFASKTVFGPVFDSHFFQVIVSTISAT